MKKIFIFLILFVFTFFQSNKCFAYSYGPGKIVNNQRPNLGEMGKIIEDNNGIYIGPDEKSIYLTFDCGYENGYTESILDVLKEEDVKAAFFITGHYLNSALDLVKRMHDENHLVCNHTMKHKHQSTISPKDSLNDVLSLEQEYKQLTGYEMEHIYRPPAGEFSKESLKCLNENGYKAAFWSLAYVDWYKDKFYGNHYSFNNVMKKIHNGAIILMHTVSKDNMVDLKDIITKLKKENYEFKSISSI